MKVCATIFTCMFLIVACSPTEKNLSSEPSYSEGFIDAGDGVKIFYQKVGDGKTKVILPMGLFLYDGFRDLAANDDRTLVFYDVRNRGRSTRITDSTLISIWQDVNDLETVRKHFNYEKVSVVGWSYLGMMVMLYTSQYPEHVERIVQVGPAALKWDQSFPPEFTNTEPSPLDTSKINLCEKQRRAGLNQTDPRKFTALWYEAYVFPDLFYDSANLNKYRPQLLKMFENENELHDNFLWHLDQHFTGSVQKMNTDSLWVEMKKIDKPLLTIHGTKDRNAVYGAGRQWANEIKDARLVTIQDVAHLPWLEKPQEVLSPIDAFLEGAWPESAKKVE